MTALLTQRRDISKELVSLLDATVELERGSLVPHETIEEVTGINRDDKDWTKLIRHWKREMLSPPRGLYVKASYPPGVGYKILTLEEQRVQEPINLQRQAIRKINKAAACVGTIPEEELDEAGRKFQVARLHQLGEIKQADKKQRAEVTSWLSNPETLPKLNGERTKIA